jgi:hypothetical protein
MDGTDSTLSACRKKPACWSRMDVAEKLEAFDFLDSPWLSRSQIAQMLDVPRTTLEHWRRNRESLLRRCPLPKPVSRFFESPVGVAFLHRLLTAAHLVFVQANDCGIRSFCWFLELSLLDEFVASSYGAQREVARQMESLVDTFGQDENYRLAAAMEPKEITVCQDETFHPQICLVAIEPVSDFILLEQYRPQRDTTTWNNSMDQALATLPVTVIQCTSDEAKALVTHAHTHLGAHHSPDIFHVQQEVSQATSFALSSQTRAAETNLDKCRENIQQLRLEKQACQQQCPNSDYAVSLQPKLHQAEELERSAQTHWQDCQERQQKATEARRGISRDYHPVDLTSGVPCTAEEVEARLKGHFDQLQRVAEEANLSERAKEKIAKARRLIPGLVATIAFFWVSVNTRLRQRKLPEPVDDLMRSLFIPAYYLQIAASKASSSQERHRLRELAQSIFSRARSPTGLWGTLEPDIRAELEETAQHCAEIFQRSSSCVEGHNGQLSLKHHALHQITLGRLRALNVLHNYAIRRQDGTTAAERFYGRAPRDLFTFVLDRLAFPTRPRTRCAV